VGGVMGTTVLNTAGRQRPGHPAVAGPAPRPAPGPDRGPGHPPGHRAQPARRGPRPRGQRLCDQGRGRPGRSRLTTTAPLHSPQPLPTPRRKTPWPTCPASLTTCPP
jgi:hypothetical protein